MFSQKLSQPKNSSYTKTIYLENLQSSTTKSNVLVVPQTVADYDIHKQHGRDYYINKDGTLNYSLTISSANQPRRFHGTYQDTIPLKQRFPNLKHNFPKLHLDSCPDDTIEKCVRETKEVINNILQEKLGEAQVESTQNIQYKPPDIHERGREMNIRVQNYVVDPMLPPPPHKLRKNRHQDPSPPPPILRTSSSSKPSKEDRKYWDIPSLVSKWKNNRGFTIDLDNRVAGSEVDAPKLNIKKLTDLSLALDMADKKAREEINIRNEQRKQLSMKQEKERELKLNQLREINQQRWKQTSGHKRQHIEPHDKF